MTEHHTTSNDDQPATPTATPPVAGPRRVVQLPWGRAQVEEEIAIDGSASGERRIEVGLMRLSELDGQGQMLRFFYRADGRIVRGPLTLRESEIDELSAALANAPKLRALLRRLAGVRR